METREFKIGDKVELINRLGRICGYGQIKNITEDIAGISISVAKSIEAYCLPGFNLLWELSRLRLVEKASVKQEEDHRGQVYNPYNNSWSFL